MDGGAWWATVHGVAKSRTQLSDFTSVDILYIIDVNIKYYKSIYNNNIYIYMRSTLKWLLLLWECLQALVPGRGIAVELWEPLELRSQSRKSKETKAARVCRAKCQRYDSCLTARSWVFRRVLITQGRKLLEAQGSTTLQNLR